MLEDLIKQIKEANIAYANGVPFLTEEEYHELWRKIYKIEPTCRDLYHTGASNDCNSYQHLRPIMGIRKAFSMEDLRPFIQRFKGREVIIQPKYDGIGAVIYPTEVPGQFRLIKQGNGHSGDDITHHLDKIEMPRCRLLVQTEVELLIPNAKWDSAYGKNPRNTTAGWMNRIESDFPDKVVHAISHHHGPLSMHMVLDSVSLDELNEKLLQCYHAWSATYPLDGLVLKVADEKLRLTSAHQSAFYNWSIAWKPPIQMKETTIENIEYHVSRNGRIIPKLRYTPIDLCGTSNKYCTGNNMQWMRERNIKVGDRILVGKAGEIIPKYISTIKGSNTPFVMPAHCPVCEGPTKHSGVHLICDSDDCYIQQAKRINYFYTEHVMNINGIGIELIKTLLTNTTLNIILNEKPWALLDPDSYGISYDIIDTIGITRFENIIEAVNEASGNRDLARFIAGLGILGLGYKKARTYCIDFINNNYDINKVPADFFEAIMTVLQANEEMENFSFAAMTSEPQIKYCITGKLSVPRADIRNYLTKYGWEFMSYVSKDTDYLIMGELKKPSSKQTNALSQGTKIISEDDLPDLIKGGK